MSESDMVFDPNMKKKKKPKKVEIEPEPEPAEEPDVSNELNFGKKKKPKKPKAPLDLGDLNASLPSESEPVAPEFNLKKKKKTDINLDDIIGDEPSVTETASTDDYTYDYLLQRVFDLIREKNPEMISGERKRVVMRPPQVARVGTKKTMFINFDEICRQLCRPHRQLLSYLFAELGTNGSLDGNNQLIIKGRFQSKHIENVLRSYIKEYVMCHTCKSTDTELSKDIRLLFLECRTCGSKCSVTSIKSGFQAVTNKRAALRAKTN